MPKHLPRKLQFITIVAVNSTKRAAQIPRIIGRLFKNVKFYNSFVRKWLIIKAILQCVHRLLGKFKLWLSQRHPSHSTVMKCKEAYRYYFEYHPKELLGLCDCGKMSLRGQIIEMNPYDPGS